MACHPAKNRLAITLLGLLSLGIGQARAIEAVIGYRNDGTGVYPADCRPVTDWQEFEMKTVPEPSGKKDRAGNPLTVEVPDPAKPVMKNIVWRTPLPSQSESSPILVGKRIFVMCEAGWPVGQDAASLVCVDGDTGKILWQKDVDPFDSLSGDERAEARKLRQLYWERMRKIYGLLLEIQAVWGKPDEVKRVQDGFRALGVWQFLPRANRESKRPYLFAEQTQIGMDSPETKLLETKYGYFTPLWSWTTLANTYPTPCSDGQRVYAVSSEGVVAAFDLDGNKAWSTWLLPPGGRKARHISKIVCPDCHAANSPLLVGDKLIWRGNGWVFGIDAATGKVVWEHELNRENVAAVGSPIHLRIGNQDVVLFTRGLVLDPASGRVLADPVVFEMKGMPHQCWMVDKASNTVFFGAGGHSGGKEFGGKQIEPGRYAVELAMEEGRLTGKILWKHPERFGDETGVFYNGKIYYDGMPVIDAATGEARGRPEQRSGVGQGLLVAGGHVWGGLNCDKTAVRLAEIQPDGNLGSRLKRHLGHAGPWDAEQMKKMNAYGSDKLGVWYAWAIGRSYPAFSGNRVFYRTFDYLYCIGDKNEPFQPSVLQPEVTK